MKNNLLFKILKFLIPSLIILFLSILIFLKTYYQFGNSPNKISQNIIDNSQNFYSGSFSNLYIEPKFRSDKYNPHQEKPSLKNWFFPPKNKNPSKPIPSLNFNSNEFTESKLAWLGHSTILINTGGIVIMTDPVFNRASPIPVIGKPFPYQETPSIKDLPKLDVIIISHDHYDHLDAKAIKELSNNADYFIVPLGVKGHLVHWGVASNKITELDWYQNINYKGVIFTLTPAQHFSGRSFSDHKKTLWGSWVINSQKMNLYFSGDSGYSKTFKEIGDVYGPFDIAFIECGGYNSNWANVHMFPYEVVQASIDLKAKVFVPISWAKFDLSIHSWKEPIIRVTARSREKNVNISTPMIGEIFDLKNSPYDHWWD